MRGSQLSFSVPGRSEVAGPVRMKRGARQGASISPAIWAITLNRILKPCYDKWVEQQAGFVLAPLENDES
eukprot:51732-Alexandrium_andersonii.AAC.1